MKNFVVFYFYKTKNVFFQKNINNGNLTFRNNSCRKQLLQFSNNVDCKECCNDSNNLFYKIEQKL